MTVELTGGFVENTVNRKYGYIKKIEGVYLLIDLRRHTVELILMGSYKASPWWSAWVLDNTVDCGE